MEILYYSYSIQHQVMLCKILRKLWLEMVLYGNRLSIKQLFLQDEDRADGEYSELQAVSQLCVPGSGSAHWTSWSWKVELLQLYQLCIQRPRHQPGHVWQLHHQPHHTGELMLQQSLKQLFLKFRHQHHVLPWHREATKTVKITINLDLLTAALIW